ncbi:hypothetical protein [Solirhodobacter olei]|uniref:hypothetical protein n=1 Tax=Solirhodobacter olei TaxID=2493082 RepID=UPI0013E38800|nr:hypothetical protein [Solirhodobacter olei]
MIENFAEKARQGRISALRTLDHNAGAGVSRSGRNSANAKLFFLSRRHDPNKNIFAF